MKNPNNSSLATKDNRNKNTNKEAIKIDSIKIQIIEEMNNNLMKVLNCHNIESFDITKI